MKEYIVQAIAQETIDSFDAYNAPELIRCKDCKHRPTDPENKGVGQSLVFPDDVCPCQIGDNWYSWMPKDDWFCADGVRIDDKELFEVKNTGNGEADHE